MSKIRRIPVTFCNRYNASRGWKNWENVRIGKDSWLKSIHLPRIVLEGGRLQRTTSIRKIRTTKIKLFDNLFFTFQQALKSGEKSN